MPEALPVNDLRLIVRVIESVGVSPKKDPTIEVE